MVLPPSISPSVSLLPALFTLICSVPLLLQDPEETAVTLHDALISMIHDPDHYVRMFMARNVPVLYVADQRTLQLVSRECQLETFEKVSGMLQNAHQVVVRLKCIF